MQFRQLGHSGLEVSLVGLGTNNFGRRCSEAESARVLDQSVESGINFIDTANIYSAGESETHIGKWLKGKRDQVLIATKFGMKMGEGPMQMGASRHHIMASIEASLTRLQTDYVDLYQLHRVDRRIPIEETLRALDDLVQQGKVRYIGASNFDAWHLCEAEWTSSDKSLNRFVSVQNYYNLLKRDIEREVSPFCEAYGVGIIPFFPLESGFLTGKYKRGETAPEGTRLAGSPRGDKLLTDANFDILEGLHRFAVERGRTLLEVAMAGLAAQPAVASIIAGATKPEQVVANVASTDWVLNAEDLAAMNEIVPSPYPQG
ncbi:MAG: aldo/keto reductase [Gemmatimonadetes bacterium]|jgi:aryl-alcohol dehydrogenase-like predicted oxidoreductase|nr:aldo/keto reductase [Gemmatimonadota bacterium]MBT4609244.1 aldo/keto reductase [Gemmatimonadota bacterium]MBT5058515.1 aldo/keto reductase [Gemmatimonadota bacterium]MBT5144835.1 aldo/keto reductase [Gemmatimonadota bacterium]MBT5586485.1 aldo/keto reductase [Gemmatimonadota bacterium]